MLSKNILYQKNRIESLDLCCNRRLTIDSLRYYPYNKRVINSYLSSFIKEKSIHVILYKVK